MKPKILETTEKLDNKINQIKDDKEFIAIANAI